MTNQQLASILEQDQYKDILDYSTKNYGVYCYKLPIRDHVMACSIHSVSIIPTALYEIRDMPNFNTLVSTGLAFRHLLNSTHIAVDISTIQTAEEVDTIIRRNHKKALEYYEKYSNFKLLDAINAL